MAVQNLTYAELADAWGISKEAARKKVERFTRHIGNDGRARVTIDLDEVEHSPKHYKPETDRSTSGPAEEDREEPGRSPSPEIVALLALVEELRAGRDRDRLEAERERAERLQERGRADDLAQQLAQALQEAAGRERSLSEALRAAERAGRAWWPWKRAS